MKNLKNKKGFTIVELVIVIAVIAILAAVLIPTFSNVIADAKESAALQNARNAYIQYLEANPEDMDDVQGAVYIKVADSQWVFYNNGQPADADTNTTGVQSIVNELPAAYTQLADGAVTTVPAA